MAISIRFFFLIAAVTYVKMSKYHSSFSWLLLAALSKILPQPMLFSKDPFNLDEHLLRTACSSSTAAEVCVREGERK